MQDLDEALAFEGMREVAMAHALPVPEQGQPTGQTGGGVGPTGTDEKGKGQGGKRGRKKKQVDCEGEDNAPPSGVLWKGLEKEELSDIEDEEVCGDFSLPHLCC